MRHGLLRAGVKALVEFEGILNMACFKENAIACTKLQHITCVNTNPNTKSAAIELDARASRAASTRSTTERISGTRVKKGHENPDWNSWTVGGLPSSEQAYTGPGGHQGRSWLARWVRWEIGAVAVMKVQRDHNQIAMDERSNLRTEAGLMAGSACVQLPLTLGGLGGIILHGEGAGGSWIMKLLCAYQQTKVA
jgi:hypothetical protein